jgi:hypothetical protein
MIPMPLAGLVHRTPSLVRVSLLAMVLAVCFAGSSHAQKRPESVQGASVAIRAPEFSAPASEFSGPRGLQGMSQERNHSI